MSNSERGSLRLNRPDDGALLALHSEIVSKMRSPLPQQPSLDETERCFRTILSLCRRAQITRLGDLTGLDRLGLLIVQATRPGALSEVTSLGRGLSIAAAAVGAIMESLERFYAETIPSDRVFFATADDLGIAPGLFENLVLTDCRNGWRERTIPWVSGTDVVTGSLQPVPLELVDTCYIEPPPHDGLFVRTTTGLACHMTSCEAFLHGLFECIERDAIARAFQTHGFLDRMRISTSGLGSSFDQMLSRAAARGISVGLWHASSPAMVPVVWCQTIETGSSEPILALPTEGYSAGPSIEAAASDALLEALAARAGAISGTRDDQTRRHFKKRTDAVVARARELILNQTPAAGDSSSKALVVSSPGDVIERVVTAGLGPVLAVPVGSDAETGVQCVRTILPTAHPFSILR
ncbi:YcaO-like family protein [Rhizobium sp. 007]|uniref:YcaO-like family protein n=1 Tax=Rhizobium sp. 007 TaxID=2785056 RepID=UPI001FED6B23|nr:YcaO-like family protein [Rhizobium sp. 007]